ncbi:MAG: sigma-54 dependent transcriptional regulator [bacterium]
MSPRVLIVDDEQHLCDHLGRYFEKLDYRVTTAYDGRSGVQQALSVRQDLVLLDLRLPDMSGMEVLRQIKEHCPDTGVVMITAYGDVDTAVQAIQHKADHFLLKPVDLPALAEVAKRVLNKYRGEDELKYLKQRVSDLRGGTRLRKLILPPEVAQAIRLLADNPASNVLILGETGTGKGVVASAIHELSERRSKQFVDINCAGLSGPLLESELFGHEKGAFTDAKSFKRGLMEVADGGSLFLDEVVELTLPVQGKILKVIEDKQFRRVGGTANIRVDTRIMAATNTDLERASQSGAFRRDLFFRLSVIPLHLPPLRERRADISPLFDRFVEEFSQAFRRELTGCAQAARSMLLSYSWPGNIRELRNVAERAVLLCQEGEIQETHLPENLQTRGQPSMLIEGEDCSLETVERDHIRQILSACNGNRSRCATLLGIHRTTLLKKIKRYGL